MVEARSVNVKKTTTSKVRSDFSLNNIQQVVCTFSAVFCTVGSNVRDMVVVQIFLYKPNTEDNLPRRYVFFFFFFFFSSFFLLMFYVFFVLFCLELTLMCVCVCVFFFSLVLFVCFYPVFAWLVRNPTKSSPA